MSIAVLIPCYNESMTIKKVIKDFKDVLPEADIYIYDNNSNDNTDRLALEAGAIVRYEHRQGKGNVIRTMFREIQADCYLIVDGDDTYPAESAREMTDLVLNEKVDMVTGLLLNPEYNLADVVHYAKGLVVSDRILWKEIIQGNLPQEVPELKIPCYFVTGNYDYLTPIQTTNNYFNAIIAPSKELVIFNDSAHFPHFEEKEHFFNFMNSLPLFTKK